VNGKNNGFQTIVFEKRSAIEQIGSLYSDIEERLKQTETLYVNLEHVEQADLSFIQLLYAAKRTAEKNGKSIIFTGKLTQSFIRTLLDSGFISESPADANALAAALIDFQR
jgi:ABC-type transporter Mla MlaB component